MINAKAERWEPMKGEDERVEAFPGASREKLSLSLRREESEVSGTKCAALHFLPVREAPRLD